MKRNHSAVLSTVVFLILAALAFTPQRPAQAASMRRACPNVKCDGVRRCEWDSNYKCSVNETGTICTTSFCAVE